MKRVILTVMMVLFVSSVYAADKATDTTADKKENTMTDGLINGQFIESMEKDGTKDRFADYYITGIVDGLCAVAQPKMDELYPPHAETQEIIKKVKTFYKENPDQKYKPIRTVIMCGCESPWSGKVPQK
jgi:hypothetical protein